MKTFRQMLLTLGFIILAASLSAATTRSWGPVKGALSTPPVPEVHPYWYAYIWSDVLPNGSVQFGHCTSKGTEDRIDAKECAIAQCNQRAGSYGNFQCHEAQDYQIVKNVWLAFAANSDGHRGFAAVDTDSDQNASEHARDQASKNCNPIDGCPIIYDDWIHAR